MNISQKSLASIIYGPSYISFEYALAYYNFIPERVNTVTSAIYNKNKNRRFSTPIGNFYYVYLPRAVYPYGITRAQEGEESYLIASKEKAICDSLYKVRGIKSVRDLQLLLFDDWRIEPTMLSLLSRDCISFLAPMYKKKICDLFNTWFSAEIHHA